MLAGVLESSRTQPKPVEAAESVDQGSESEDARPKGRGANTPKARPAVEKTKRTRPRTVHLTDDVFERVVVQALRRRKTISEYIGALLDRHTPDHRVVRGGETTDDAA